MHLSRPLLSHQASQRGVALMIMLVILSIGALTMLVASLNSSALRIQGDKVTADALAKAKEALIGRAVSDASLPGSLPCPDSNDDGSADVLVGNDCPTYIGRLPWKTLGLADLRDGTGEHLWYALSRNFRDDNSAQPLNSEINGTLALTGTQVAGNLIAIVFAPSNAMSGQSRSATQSAACTTSATTVTENLCARNYLEGSNANLNTLGAPNLNFQTAATSATFNDQMIFITHDQLFQPVETRIAREARSCLDSYAAVSAGKYPWATTVADMTHTGTANTYFGRIPTAPIASGGASTPTITALLAQQALLANVQAALAAYVANPNAANTTNLRNTAQTLINSTSNALTSSVNGTVDNAGDRARDLANATGVTLSTVNTNIASASSALNTALTNAGYTGGGDPSMQTTWPAFCLFTSAYWASWQNQVFYQVANGYQPGSTPGCVGCLSITGSGNPSAGSGTYRAAVLVARNAITGQVRSTTDSTTYLEVPNRHATAFTTVFETYKPTDNLSTPRNFTTVNDLVLCVDGAINCK